MKNDQIYTEDHSDCSMGKGLRVRMEVRGEAVKGCGRNPHERYWEHGLECGLWSREKLTLAGLAIGWGVEVILLVVCLVS